MGYPEDNETENLPIQLRRENYFRRHSDALVAVAQKSPLLAYSLIRREQKNALAIEKEKSSRLAMCIGAQVLLESVAAGPDCDFHEFTITKRESGIIFSRSESWSFKLQRYKSKSTR